MRKCLFAIIVGTSFFCTACSKIHNNGKHLLSFGFLFKFYNEKKMNEDILKHEMELALAIEDFYERYEKVKILLLKGANPNIMAGQIPWVDTNPLWWVCGNYMMAKLFIDFGADIHNRPYIARIITGYRIATNERQLLEWDGYPIEIEDDILDSVKLFLEEGADPNLKCIGGEVILNPATDWNYKRYFNKYGETAINHSIKYGAMKLTSLLLEYGARLDKDSLIYAKKSVEYTGNTDMLDFITNLLEDI